MFMNPLSNGKTFLDQIILHIFHRCLERDPFIPASAISSRTQKIKASTQISMHSQMEDWYLMGGTEKQLCVPILGHFSCLWIN